MTSLDDLWFGPHPIKNPGYAYGEGMLTSKATYSLALVVKKIKFWGFPREMVCSNDVKIFVLEYLLISKTISSLAQVIKKSFEGSTLGLPRGGTHKRCQNISLLSIY